MAKYEPFDWYEQALYYDIVFDAETDQEADFLEAVHARHVESTGRRVLEPACGSGRLMTAMARRGFDVTGFDISPDMLEFARQRLRRERVKAKVFEAKMESFALETRFDLAHCLVSTFKYLPTENAARAHLRRVATALKPGGVYVLGLHVTDYADRHCNRERWVAERDGVHVTCNIQGWPADRRSRTEAIRARFVVRENRCERRYETHWTFRTYSLRQLRSLLADIPDLEHVESYDFTCEIDRPVEFDGDVLDVILVLQRR